MLYAVLTALVDIVFIIIPNHLIPHTAKTFQYIVLLHIC